MEEHDRSLEEIEKAHNKKIKLMKESLEVLRKQQRINRVWIACAATQFVLSVGMLIYGIICSCLK